MGKPYGGVGQFLPPRHNTCKSDIELVVSERCKFAADAKRIVTNTIAPRAVYGKHVSHDCDFTLRRFFSKQEPTAYSKVHFRFKSTDDDIRRVLNLQSSFLFDFVSSPRVWVSGDLHTRRQLTLSGCGITPLVLSGLVRRDFGSGSGSSRWWWRRRRRGGQFVADGVAPPFYDVIR
ncbi:hypothetical protein Q1695_013167 [Nippostrongylus brasiliensis]|nr:hypothetical protein Q1695_013167 [Nippostrongylus brasiliensis]